jgi:hypothetical protein
MMIAKNLKNEIIIPQLGVLSSQASISVGSATMDSTNCRLKKCRKKLLLY